MKLQLVKTGNFHDLPCNFYEKDDEVWMTRRQIGKALGYSDPRLAITKIHQAHKDRLDNLSSTETVLVDGKNREVTLYNEMGVFEICRWSRQPKADEFMDWVWEIIKSYRHGNLQVANPDDRLQKFCVDQMEIINRMYQDNKRLYKVTIKGFNALADIVKEMRVERKEFYRNMDCKPSNKISIEDKESIIAEYKMDQWKAEVYNLIDNIIKESDELGNTRREILSQVYVYLTNAYGIVWEQARKEYKEKYHIESRVSTIDICYDMYPDYVTSTLEKVLRQFRKENADPDWDTMKIKIVNYARHIGNKSAGGTSVYRKIYKKMAENGVDWKKVSK